MQGNTSDAPDFPAMPIEEFSRRRGISGLEKWHLCSCSRPRDGRLVMPWSGFLVIERRPLQDLLIGVAVDRWTAQDRALRSSKRDASEPTVTLRIDVFEVQRGRITRMIATLDEGNSESNEGATN